MLTFDEGKHEYRYNGKVIPSVSELCGRILGSSYADVPAHVLKQAADFGTDVHLAVEFYNRFELVKDLPARKAHCLNEWIKLSKQVQILESEKMGHYQGKFAGTLDAKAILLIDGRRCILDFKTTALFHDEKFALQLSLYRLIEGWNDIDGLIIGWIPKQGFGELREVISWELEDLMKALEEVL